MIITISGDPGSGKSTLGKKLAEKFSLKFYSIGDVWAKLALEKGVVLEELQKFAEKSKKIDQDIDNIQVKIGKTENNFIMDSRLGWYFIPNSFKIYLKCDLKEASKRIFKNQRPDEKKYNSVGQVLRAIRERSSKDEKRLKKLYNIDFSNQKNYDFVLDTTNLSQEKVFKKICEKLSL